MKLGEYLQALRRERGLSLRKVVELSKSLKVSPSGSISLAQLVNIEKGRVAEPGIAKLATLSRIYGVRFGDLIAHVPGTPSWAAAHAITELAGVTPEVKQYLDDTAVIGLMRALQAPGDDADRRRTILNSILVLSGEDLKAVEKAVNETYLRSQALVDFLARTPEARKWLSNVISKIDKRGRPARRTKESPDADTRIQPKPPGAR